ncbi:WD40 repeat-like protein [Pholiota conissans]|uniref:WD40 repeat-like protein n=1 Tax=Pholiota conissans TaxID=109636 RepID=A0A9P5ZF69_9AGAR|nr:WD40 repeat-like protein [Pholiota conissans]
MAASTPKHPKSTPTSAKDPPKTPSNKRKGKENNPKSIAIPNPIELWSAQSAQNLDDDTPWNWASLTDPSSSRILPVFTKDGSYFFSLVGPSVKIHSTTTGLVVSTLSSSASDRNAQSDVLTSALINPHNAFQLITGSLDGSVRIWDFINGTLLQTIELGQPIHYMCAHEQFKGSIFVAASPSRRKTSHENNAIVLQISLKPSEHTNQPVEITSVGKTRFPSGLAVSSNGAWLVAAAGHTIYVAKTSSLVSGFTKYVSPERLRCLAFHPTEEYFATGDDKGVIRLWYCLNDNLAVNTRGVEKRTQTRPLHWHAHAVSSISFTPNGAYLLSGGEEAVLVLWQLHTGKKEFVPRLGAPISTVSILSSRSAEEEYLIGLADATYTFISSATLKVTRSYSRIKIDPTHSHLLTSSSKMNFAPIAIQPRTSTLVLPSSHPSSLQIYSPSGSTLVGELEVSPSNRVSRRDDKPLIPAFVETAVISPSGGWMATIDSREGDCGFHDEVYLKFWSWDKHRNNWVLNTRIDRPHGTERVTDISFSPDETSGLLLVTTGRDGRIKVWRLWSRRIASGSTTPAGPENIWVSSMTITYRSEIPSSLSWSPDASLFAVAVGPYLAVYDAASGTLLQSLTSPSSQKSKFVHFIGSDGQYLLSTCSNSLIMWDLINNSVAWQCPTSQSIEKIVPHPQDPTFAVFYTPVVVDEELRTRASIFSTASNNPSSTRTIPFGLRNVVWASFSSRPGFNIVGITHSWRVVTIGDADQTLHDEGLTARAVNNQQQPQKKTLFQDIFGISAFAATSPDTSTTPTLQRKDKTHEIFDTPAYLAPSLDSLFEPLITTLLTLRLSEPIITDDIAEEADEDIVMEEEQDVIASVPSYHPSRMPHPGEMEIFTKLFRTRCMTEDRLSNAVSKMNARLNGVHHKEVNGASRAVETPASISVKRLSNSQVEHAGLPATIPPSPSPLANGKKRKKAAT